jgi:hypothetical protein
MRSLRNCGINPDRLAPAYDKAPDAEDVDRIRYLQTIREVASERNTTTFFPLPLDLFAALLCAFSTAELPKG